MKAGWVSLIAVLLLCRICLAQGPRDPHVAATPPLSPEEQKKRFHLPPGFEVQLVAAEPFVRKPININFDQRGRLWVTESIEYPFPAAPNARHRDCIRILEDTNGDGLADELTTFATGLNIPIGILPIQRGAIAYSIPNIYRFEDQDGDDRADKRDLLIGTQGYNDTHGMTGEFTWGFDGWVYACHGFANTSQLAAKDGSVINLQSGNTYRFKPDGSHIEQFTWGQVNPFGLAFDPLGNLYSCDCHSRPVYQLLRGAYYPSFGKPHDGLGFGPEMLLHDHGSTAIAGIAYYAADHFPAEYRDTIFIGNVVTNRINHDRLKAHGSTYEAIAQPDFLRSDDPWFRPVDIKLGPDGALYVADFYNRIIGHYEVPLLHPGRDRERGRIWRIVYKGPDGKSKDPQRPRADLAKAGVADLIDDLGHTNLTVRMQATNQLVERVDASVNDAVRKAMLAQVSVFRRMHGVWVLARRNALDDELLKALADDKDRGVRVHVMRVLGERPKHSALDRRLLVAGLKDADAFVQRAAAEALSLHPDKDNIRPLLDLHHAIPPIKVVRIPELRNTLPEGDTHLLHMTRMALRNQLRSASAWSALPMKPWSEADARAVADVAPGVPSAEAAAFLLAHLKQFAEPAANRVRFAQHVARHGANDSLDTLVETCRSSSGSNLTQQLGLFKAVQQGVQARGAALTESAQRWASELANQALASTNEPDVLNGMEIVGALKMAGMRPLLLKKSNDAETSEAQRQAALTALVAIDARQAVSDLGQVLADAAAPITLRERSASLLGGINQAEAQAELLKTLASAPGRLEVAIAVALASSRPGAEKLLDAVTAGKASARLLQERQVEVKLTGSNLPGLKDRVAKLTRGLQPADQRLLELLNRRRQGFASAKTDSSQGAKVYEKNCAACHQLANKGAKIGPQLDGIGIRGPERLLEDILDPNRNVDQAFRSTILNLTNGQIVSGLLLREEGAILVMADPQGKEVRVAKNTVEERVVSPLSPMPANLADVISEADFYHLLAFLLEQRTPGK